jgi:hypothetical protein
MKHLKRTGAFAFLQDNDGAVLADRHRRRGVSDWRKAGLPWEQS